MHNSQKKEDKKPPKTESGPVPSPENHATLFEYDSAIRWFTLRFRESKLESKYQTRPADPTFSVKSFKILFIILLIIVAFRRIEALAFSLAGSDLSTVSKLAENLNVILLAGTGVLEILFYFWSKLKIIQGFPTIFYMFYSTAYSSYSVSKTTMCVVPTYTLSQFITTLCLRGIPAYMCAFVLGASYTRTWIVPATACLTGTLFQGAINHMYSVPICTPYYLPRRRDHLL